ncbi:hypothetical protein E2C01_059980 [Portunus trituberculatus]|uniref:Uncharacterized protein n=1 Tax=Portunus trituberculatus TaxID=210409 RepID=A0A5B7HAR7_PORTR|nr:hypothetical protein [Portunus trituberculatus]
MSVVAVGKTLIKCRPDGREMSGILGQAGEGAARGDDRGKKGRKKLGEREDQDKRSGLRKEAENVWNKMRMRTEEDEADAGRKVGGEILEWEGSIKLER